KLRSKCMCFPLRIVAFRGHGFSLLALAKGMWTLFAKNGFSRPSLRYCGFFRHVLFPQMFSMGRVIAVPGVNGPPLQTTIVIVKARYTELLPNTMLAKEIHEDSCGKAKTMRPHNERPLRVRRLIASPRKA